MCLQHIEHGIIFIKSAKIACKHFHIDQNVLRAVYPVFAANNEFLHHKIIQKSFNLQQSFAVTKDEIYNEAKKHIGSTKWKLERETCKCNIFVDDVLANVGAKRPQR